MIRNWRLKCREDLDHGILTETVSYDETTGIFRWKMRRRGIRLGDPVGYINPHNGYRYICLFGTDFLAHRLAWFYVRREWPKDQIDHIDLDKTNNSIRNLREATPSTNGANCRPKTRSKSPLKGVSWVTRNKKWLATIRSNGKRKYLGLYSTPEEAHAAYVRAATLLHGEFARAA